MSIELIGIYMSVILAGLGVSTFPSILLHEYGHYLAIKHYKGTPLLGFYFKTGNFYITPFEGEDFYWNLYEQDEKTAWKKQIVISAAGLFTSLLLAVVFMIISPFIFLSGHMFVALFFALLGLLNLFIFFGNWKNPNSDGYKIKCALKHKETYVAYLKSINHRFIPEDCIEEIERVRNKYLSKSTDLS